MTTFEVDTPGGLKKKLRAAVNALGEDLDPEMQERVVKEGVNVFKLNNSIIHTVEGVDAIFYKKLFKFLAVLIIIIAVLIAAAIF